AFSRRQVFDDICDVGRVKFRQAFVDDLQLHATRRIRFKQVDVLPRDHARRDFFKQRAHREGRDDAVRQAPDGAPRTDVDGDDAERDVVVYKYGVEFDVVDAHDLAPVDVDDLSIEQVPLEQQHAVRRGIFFPT